MKLEWRIGREKEGMRTYVPALSHDDTEEEGYEQGAGEGPSVGNIRCGLIKVRLVELSQRLVCTIESTICP